MEDLNKPILDHIIKTAFPQISTLSYKITEYSLKSTFCFKFDNLAHFTTFLQQHQTLNHEALALLESTLQELHLKPDTFFYINFYDESTAKGL